MPAKEKATIRRTGVKAAATTNQQAMISGESKASPLSKARGHSNRERETPLKRLANPLTLAPRKQVMNFLRCRNICYELSFGIPCDSEKYPHMYGHILPG